MVKILLVPHPKLRQLSRNIDKVTQAEIDLSKKMLDVMLKAPGVGLAANQIGVLKKIVTIHINDQEKNIDKSYALFNPIIKSYSEEKVVMEEGCLSIPDQYAKINRPKGITLEYFNEKKKSIKMKVDGIEARVLQHEIDHLSGKLFIDYLSSLKRNIMIKKVKKLIKNGEI